MKHKFNVKRLARMVRNKRRKEDLSRKGLADKLGIGQSTVWRLERVYQQPQINNLLIFTGYLNRPPADFFQVVD